MSEFLLEHYLILKAFHVVSIIAWMAGMLYLPRLFAYHADADGTMGATFKIMERRLLRIIMNPAMGASWLFGLLMVCANPALLQSGWFHIKLTAIVIMTGLHHLFSRWRKIFEHDENIRPAKFYKIWNEVPTVVMIIIVFMAVIKPF